MAIDYTTDTTSQAGIFTRIGQAVKKLNSYTTTATTTYPADLKAIADKFEAQDRVDEISGLYATYQGWSLGVGSQQQQLAAVADTVLTDRVDVVDQLGMLAGASITTVLPALYRQMSLVDSKTVKKCAVTVGSPSYAGYNVGSGTLFTNTVLDGAQKPTADGLAMALYQGVTSELCVTSETMTLVCTGDQGGGATLDGETFSWVGADKFGKFDYRGEGSGSGPTLTVLNAGSVVTNGEFETFTVANTPDNWTNGAGTVFGTHVKSDAVTFYRGLKSVQLLGDAALATVEINQALTASFQPLTTYALSVAVKASAAGAGGKNVVVSVSGTGYTPGSAEKVTLSGGSLPTAWTVYCVFWRAPAVVPTDLTLKIQLTGTPAATPTVNVDACVVGGPIPFHGGVGACIVAGPVAWQVGDKITFTTANNNAGVWQTFFRRWYGFQLPSATAGSETVSDSLAS